MDYIVMACTVMVYIVVAYIVMAYIDMAYMVMAYIVVARYRSNGWAVWTIQLRPVQSWSI